MYLGSTYTVAGKCDPFRWICHRLVSGVYFAVQVKLTDEVARLTSVAVKYRRREPNQDSVRRRAFGYSDWEKSGLGGLLVVIRVLQVLSGRIIAYFLLGT